MEPSDLDVIKDQLKGEQAKLSTKADGLKAELAGIEDALTRIEGALAVLSGTTLTSTATRLAKREKRKASAPSTTKAQVIDLIMEELSANNIVQESELKSLIEQRLIQSGFGRNGFALRFKEALSDARFNLAVNGVSLKRRSSPNQDMGSQTKEKSDERLNALTQ